jgi:hypothetical protein
VSDWLTSALTVISLGLAALATAYVALDRLPDRLLWALVGLVGVVGLALLVVGVIDVVTTEVGVSKPTYIGYLLGIAAAPPVATVWALGERTRAGTAVLIVAGLVIPVLVVRLGQVWDAGVLHG